MGRPHKPAYEIIKFSKGNGKFRTIYKPRGDIKALLRRNIPILEKLALKHCPPGVVHGFWPARNCVTNAAMHIGYRFTVSFDLTDFFDHCTKDKVLQVVSAADLNPPIIDNAFPDGAARQGLPSSPAMANICAAPLDWDLVRYCSATGIAYSRYADDLTFSCNEWWQVRILLHFVPEAVSQHGFEINARKTHTQCDKAGRRVVTGVAVDATGVYPTRKTRRRLRAADHKAGMKQGNPHWKHRASGLREWSRCKLPGLGKRARKAIESNPQDCLQIAAEAAQFAASLPTGGDP
jgi:hypothetical protein